MKRNLLFVGAFAVLALASRVPARADAYVDGPSFGRIVYGMTGGLVVLPQSAWQGAYPDGSGTPTLPTPLDTTFGGGAILVDTSRQYGGDVVNAARGLASPGSDFGIDYSSAVTYNGGSATPVALNNSGVFDSGTSAPQDLVTATKLGFVASYAWDSQIGVYATNGGAAPLPSDVVTLFGTHTGALSTSTVTVGNTFGIKYWSDGTSTVPPYDYYSDNPANNSGSAANKLYNHVESFQVTDPSNPFYRTWFIGLEDTSFNTAGNPGYHRFDYNDNIMQVTFEAVPEPVYYQMAALLVLGAFGLVRARRRTA